jgi:hypothetical protein
MTSFFASSISTSECVFPEALSVLFHSNETLLCKIQPASVCFQDEKATREYSYLSRTPCRTNPCLYSLMPPSCQQRRKLDRAKSVGPSHTLTGERYGRIYIRNIALYSAGGSVSTSNLTLQTSLPAMRRVKRWRHPSLDNMGVWYLLL